MVRFGLDEVKFNAMQWWKWEMKSVKVEWMRWVSISFPSIGFSVVVVVIQRMEVFIIRSSASENPNRSKPRLLNLIRARKVEEELLSTLNTSLQ